MIAPVGDPGQMGSDLLERLLARTHLCRTSDVPDVVASEAASALGASDVVIYWVNREQTALVPLRAEAAPQRAHQLVEGSMAGRAFTSSKVLSAPADVPGRRRVFLPLLDGTDRIGALELEIAVQSADLPEDLQRALERLAHFTAQTLVVKSAYGDDLELAPRSRALDLGAELVWSVLPPLTFATDHLVITAILEPAYENGGDAYDYAVNADVTHLAVFDGLGHGLPAAHLSTIAVGAYRHSRRTGLGLVDTYHALDDAIAAQFANEPFVTAVLAQLDTDTGMLRWVNAGHPPPLILRDNRVVKSLERRPATPLGMQIGVPDVVVHEEHLEPGDAVVLYTDGVTEARRPDGTLLGVDGLTDFLNRGSAAPQSPPETLRRLQQGLLGGEATVVRDDATVLSVHCRRGTERLLLPETV